MLAIICFALGSLLCGVASTFATFLAGRVVQGIGGGGIITLTQMVFADIVPLSHRPKYFALVLATWAVGTVLGPMLGALLVEKVSWRWW